MYDSWLAAMIETVGEFDPEFTPEVDEAWRAILSQGIDYMKRNYE